MVRVMARRFDSPQQEAFLNLWRTYDRLRMLEDELFDGYGLTAQQYNALRLLKGARPDRLSTLGLAGRLVSRAPDITRLVDRLVERGLVQRDRLEANRRVVELAITDAGVALLAQMADAVRACHERQLGHLKPTELKTLVELLRKARGPHEPGDSEW
jgi:DNA-binding MarR family transcriptional regulator